MTSITTAAVVLLTHLLQLTIPHLASRHNAMSTSFTLPATFPVMGVGVGALVFLNVRPYPDARLIQIFQMVNTKRKRLAAGGGSVVSAARSSQCHTPWRT